MTDREREERVEAALRRFDTALRRRRRNRRQVEARDRKERRFRDVNPHLTPSSIACTDEV